MSISTSRVLKFGLTEVSGFGKYRLIAKLGQGGMADVFLAVARGPVGFTKLVVIKRLKPDVGTEAEFHGMFTDEARLAARLNHPNVVQTNEVGNVDEHLYLCMEYLEGQPLNRVIQRMHGKKPAVPEYLRIVSDALAGLHYAHELADYDGTPLSVVHRDISPHNIFVTYEGVAKVVDFGIAKAALRSQNTSTGVVKGKISYMAPEQAVSTPIDRRADIFSMGVILWELVSGLRMWDNMTEIQILHELAFGEVPKLSKKAPGTPMELESICSRALSMVADERYPTAAAMREDLEAYIKQSGQSASTADVSRFVCELFQDRRDEVKAVIQDQLASMDQEDGPPRDVTIPDIGATGSSVAAVKAAPAEAPPPRARAPKASGETPQASGIIATGSVLIPPRRRSRAPLFVAGGVIAAAAGLLLFVFGRTTAPSATDARPQAVAAPPAPVTTGGAAQPAQRPMIELRIEATPREATIYVDDAPVAQNPFSAKFPADGSGHRVRIEAPGHKPTARIVVFDQDRSVEVKLEAEAAPVASATAAPTQAPTATAAPARPGGAAPPVRRGPKVDTSDPWK